MAQSNININEFLFGRTRAEKKLETIKAMSDADIRKATSVTILRIYKECKEKGRDRFYISSDRRVGNNWCSTIEFIYEYKGKPMLCLYVQNSSTDSSECVSYIEFNGANRYNGYCRNLGKSFTYDSSDIARTIRCILMEYVYWKYIEKAERERSENIRKVLYEVGKFGKVCDYFYDDWRCKYEMGGWNSPTPRTNRYYRAKKAVVSYVEEHLDELIGKTSEEVQSIFKQIFRNTD